MNNITRIIRQVSIKSLAVHLVGLVVSGAIIWGVSYLLLVTFSIQDNNKNAEIELLNMAKNGAATSSRTGTSTSSSTKTNHPLRP